MTEKSERLIHPFGPYSKTYLGFSHIPALTEADATYPLPPDMPSAARLDCVVQPLLHSSLQPMPNTTVAATCHPWRSGQGLEGIRYRWELGLGPSEQAYAEVDFERLGDRELLIRTRFVNHTDRRLDALLNYYLTMDYPHAAIGRARIAPGARYVAGEDRLDVQFARPRPWDRQQPDAQRKAVFRDPAFTDGFGFGDRLDGGHVPMLRLQPWGLEAGDSVRYRLPSSPEPGDALAIRYRTAAARPRDGMADFAREATGIAAEGPPPLTPVGLALRGAAQGSIQLPPAEGLALLLLKPGETGFAWGEGEELELVALGAGSGLEIDCLLTGPEEAIQACAFDMEQLLPAPLELLAHAEGYDLSYPREGVRYRLTFIDAVVRQRLIHSGCLEDAEPMRVSNPHFTFDELQRPFSGSFPRKQSSPGLWVDIVEPQLIVAPHSELTRYALLQLVDQAEAPPQPAAPNIMAHAFGRHVGKATRARLPELVTRIPAREDPLPAAPALIRQGMGILEATLMQNIVYPIYTKAGWIAHFTPGKRWDSLYTWDSGFIALGLLKTSRAHAEYMLDLYLAQPDDPEQAFVHHGSPVPVQFMALRELVAESEPTEQLRLLRRFYERMRLYYEFLMGRTHNSTTARLHSGLLTTYDYFYSSSGMDDYPAQVTIHLKGLARQVAPAITTAQAMLAAHTLTLLSQRYAVLCSDGPLQERLQEHRLGYAQDARQLAQALEAHAWDEESGYYGFTLHDEEGQPAGLLRDEDGQQLNCGFDGVYPLVAGCGEAPHQARLIAHLKAEDELLTPYGLTAVSQRAPYFSLQGYWNGGVWYPHAWYFGRAMLDCGEGAFLLDLVQRQLTHWCAQARDRWNSYEMLRLASGEGAWHASFSGLTSPLLNWAHSLYAPGTVTTGLATLLTQKREQAGSLLLRLQTLGAQDKLSLWYVLGDAKAPACSAYALRERTAGAPGELLLVLGDTAPFAEELRQARPIPCEGRLLMPGLLQLRLS